MGRAIRGFRLNDTVCFPHGARRTGRVIAIIVPIPKGKERVRVLQRDGTIYEEPYDKLVHCDPDKE